MRLRDLLPAKQDILHGLIREIIEMQPFVNRSKPSTLQMQLQRQQHHSALIQPRSRQIGRRAAGGERFDERPIRFRPQIRGDSGWGIEKPT